MPSKLSSARHVAALAGVALLLPLLPMAAHAAPPAPGAPDAPTNVAAHVPQGVKAIDVTWSAPVPGGAQVLGYHVLIDGTPVATVDVAAPTSARVSSGLVLGHAYDVSVTAFNALGDSVPDAVPSTQLLYVNPVTIAQTANPTNPLAGREWGVYTGGTDPYINGWSGLSQALKDQLAGPAMTQKARFFGKWIPNSQAYQNTVDYIAGSQAGDPTRLTMMTLFRMDPWEGQINHQLPTKAQQASYKSFVQSMARAIGNNPVAVVVQPDGYFAKTAYDHFVKKVGKKKALLPARMLKWTAKTLSAQPNTTVYMEMGSGDWTRYKVKPVATFLKYAGVKFTRGFALNTSHKDYLDREILFAKKVAKALAKKGIPNLHAVLDTSDNGHPFSGDELNPQGLHTHPYTPPGDVNPCKKSPTKKLCTMLGVPPTTDVDNPLWGLPAKAAKAAAKYIDAYLWISRPWIPSQGRGGTSFSATFAQRLVKTDPFSPFFVGTP